MAKELGKIGHWIGTGPSIRARARLALAAAFLVAAPALFVGVLRTTGVQEFTNQFRDYDLFLHQLEVVERALDQIELSLWRFEAVREQEHQRALMGGKVKLERAVSALVAMRPQEFDKYSIEQIYSSFLHLNEAIDRSIRDKDMTAAQLAFRAMERETKVSVDRVSFIADDLYDQSRRALVTVARDQLILFLILLFAIPLFLGFVPEWLAAPLVRLKRVELQIEEGRIRELSVSGSDEVSQVARALKSALMWRESLEDKKSAKIFEVRNVLRAVISHVNEPVLIIGKETKVNYCNPSAASLLDIEAHHLENTLLIDHVFAPALVRAIEKAQSGDVTTEPISVGIELADGRSLTVKATLSAVYDRAGTVSRVVVIFYP